MNQSGGFVHFLMDIFVSEVFDENDEDVSKILETCGVINQKSLDTLKGTLVPEHGESGIFVSEVFDENNEDVSKILLTCGVINQKSLDTLKGTLVPVKGRLRGGYRGMA